MFWFSHWILGMRDSPGQDPGLVELRRAGGNGGGVGDDDCDGDDSEQKNGKNYLGCGMSKKGWVKI